MSLKKKGGREGTSPSPGAWSAGMSVGMNKLTPINNSFWIANGRCTYMQEGCKHKHEIPPDEGTRLKIGMRGIPRWLLDNPAEFQRYWPTAPQAPVLAFNQALHSDTPALKHETPEHTHSPSEGGPPKRRHPSSSPYSYEYYQGRERMRAGASGYFGAMGDMDYGDVAPQYAPGRPRVRLAGAISGSSLMIDQQN